MIDREQSSRTQRNRGALHLAILFMALTSLWMGAVQARQLAMQPDSAAVTGHTEAHTLTSGGLQRKFRLYVPRSVVGHKAPLVVVLHGSYGSGAQSQAELGFDAYALDHGFVMAYPDVYRADSRRTARWNDGRETLSPGQQAVDDVRFVADLISDVATKQAIDPSRVFVTGASNGGIMAYRVGCELKGRVRAIAPVIGNVAEALAGNCRPESGMSVLAVNGDIDPFVPLNGGDMCVGVNPLFCEGGRVLSRHASLQFFAGANACVTTAHSHRREPDVADGTWVESLDHADCRDHAVVRSLVVHGMGHAWPPRSGRVASSGPGSMNLDATKEIVDFFMTHAPR